MTRLILAVCTIVLLASCAENTPQDNAPVGDSTAPSMTTLGGGENGDGGDSAFITKDTANKMIQSYLTSVGAPDNDSNLRSLIIDANSLRNYLNNSEQGRKITKMKLMFAHTPEYIRAGGSGKNCGYKSGALTIVLAGFDSAGNYVLYPGNMVMDRAKPCPSSCEVVGTAASDLIVD